MADQEAPPQASHAVLRARWRVRVLKAVLWHTPIMLGAAAVVSALLQKVVLGNGTPLAFSSIFLWLACWGVLPMIPAILASAGRRPRPGDIAGTVSKTDCK